MGLGARVGLLAAALTIGGAAQAQLPDTILYGVAYYDEYTPVDRVDEDARDPRCDPPVAWGAFA